MAVVAIPVPPAMVNVSPNVAAAEPDPLASVISLDDTAPEATVKFAVAKDAIPLFVVVASSPAIVRVPAPSS